jgi:hypothetical protein
VIPGVTNNQLQGPHIDKQLQDYLLKKYEAWLLSVKLPITTTGKIKTASASKLSEWASANWKKISGKRHNSRSSCDTRALLGTDDILRGNFDLDCPNLKRSLEKCVDSECGT